MTHADKPFRHWIIDGWCQPCGPLPADAPWEARYANELERGKRTTRAVALLPPDFRAVFSRLTCPGYVRHWAEEAAIPGLDGDPLMYGGGLHVTDPGGFLQVHLDHAISGHRPHLERRLSLIAFIHPTWRPEWGGQLLFCHPDGRAAVRIEPTPGRLVVWENGDLSYHGVRRTADAAPPRVTAAVYHLAPARKGTTRARALFLPNRQAPDVPAEVA